MSVDIDDLSVLTHSAWLTTAASQIFFMQLGFLCLEGGYIEEEYMQSLVIKNIEDIFFGFTTYASFGYAVATFNYKYILLWNLPYSEWDTIFVNASFAASAATIISGAVLERMKDSAYSLWVFLIVFVNYSILSQWIWDEQGWLYKLGFIDCAGCSAVHMIGGIAGLIAIVFLGPRYTSLTAEMDDKNIKKLKDKRPPNNLLIMIIGLFILWYGWVAFNTASPIIGNVGIGGDVGLAGLLTIVLPSCSSASTYFATYITWPNWKCLKTIGIKPKTRIIERSAENLAFAVLSGLVVVTGCCYTINLWSAIIVGFIIPFPLFYISYILRSKFKIDDPLDAVTVHLFGGILGLLVEGLFNFDNGLLITGNPYHFGIECLGIVVTLLFNSILCLLYWLIIFKLIIFRKTDIKTSPLQVCLETSKMSTYTMDYGLAFKELMFGTTNFTRLVMLKFHLHLQSVYCSEQLDFIIAVHEYRRLFNDKEYSFSSTRSVLGRKRRGTALTAELGSNIHNAFICICNLYIASSASKEVNISHKNRSKIMILCNKINEINNNNNELNDDLGDKLVIDKMVFNAAFIETLKHTLTNLQIFVQKYNTDDREWIIEKKKKSKIFNIDTDTYDVKWIDNEDDSNKPIQMHRIRNNESLRYKNAANYYITSRDGRIKSIEEEITDILQ